jgi:hypothetical protein
MRRLILCAAPVVATLLPAILSATAVAHGGNPNYRSELGSIRPAVAGLQVQVLNYDDRLLLINRTGKTVLLEGYENEPYARLRADGTVEVNKRSPSYYLNEERYGGTPVPAGAGPEAPPRWSRVSGNGRFETHDHRIHWMSKEARPPQVTDEDRRTKVFDWRVPIEVGPRRAAITGTLFWEPDSGGGIPTAAIVALAVLVALTLALFGWSRRVRARGASSAR